MTYQIKPHRRPTHPAKQQPLQPLGTIQSLDIGEDDGRGLLAFEAVKAVKGDLPLAPDLGPIGPIGAGTTADGVFADPFTPPERGLVDPLQREEDDLLRVEAEGL